MLCSSMSLSFCPDLYHVEINGIGLFSHGKTMEDRETSTTQLLHQVFSTMETGQ